MGDDASDSEKMPSKLNGIKTKQEKLSGSDSDDLEVIEVTPSPKLKSLKSNTNTKTSLKSNINIKPKKNGNKLPELLPISSTRKEIKVLSRLPQSTISRFFTPPKHNENKDKDISKPKINKMNNASVKNESKFEKNKKNEENKKDAEQDKPVIKWKKVTDTRDT